jgi:FkbM family methyltransferase
MICNRNMKMRLGPYVVRQQLLEGQSIKYMDVGARGGIHEVFRQIQGGLQVIGCEPDINECRKLNAFFKSRGINVSLYPYAMHDKDGKHVINISQFPYSSGIFAADPAFMHRLSEINDNNLRVVDHVIMDTTTIDNMLKQENLAPIDFLKIDTEGSEHCVLKGALNQLRGPYMLGVESEFWTGPIKNSDNLSIIHDLLTHLGFYLFDINIGRYTRRSFPRGYMTVDKRSGQSRTIHPQNCGQILTGDVVYLRDPVWEITQGVHRFIWNDVNVLKMAILYELYMLSDCAVELLQAYQANFSSNLDFEKLYDLLVPDMDGVRRLGYREYVAASKALPWQEKNVFKPYWRDSQHITKVKQPSTPT